ncbi:MAG: Fic family protein, partial [Candidatus Omnitrophota bacterium]|nr:Fic family protein [Candidatus Omnitrophota bacterium]
MKSYLLSDKEKLDKILKVTGVSRSELARRLEVGYKTVYRWLDKGIMPHPSQSRNIDQLFKEYVNLKDVISRLREKIKDPVKILKTNKAVRHEFLLKMTYHSNAIEGSRMTLKETEMAFEGKGVKGKELFEVFEAVNHKNALEFLLDNIKPDYKIDQNYILKLHEIVMYNFNDKLPGKYRTGYVNLTNTDKVLPSAQDVPLKMGKFIKEINNYGKDPIGKIARDHYEFEAIHPF